MKKFGRASIASFPRGIVAISTVFLLSGCLQHAVAPTAEGVKLTSQDSSRPTINVAGTETFDRTIMPVTLSCGANEYTVAFASGAQSIIAEQLRERVRGTSASSAERIDVEVQEVMIRLMNFLSEGYDMRFEVEARIGFAAKVLDGANVTQEVSSSFQSIHTGEIDDDTITCGLGKTQLEKSLPVLLRRAVDKLAAELV